MNVFSNHPKLDGILITKKENIRYLSGFLGSFGLVLITKNENFLITDARYAEKAQKNLKKDWKFQLFNKDFKKTFSEKSSGDWGIEDSISLFELKKYKKLFPNIKFKPVNNVVETFRRQKTENEINKTRAAQNHIDKILIPFMQSTAVTGITEQELACKLETAIRDHGRYGISFDPIIAFGSNSSIPHHTPSATKLKNNQNILVDCGAKFEGYCSDITRNFVVGESSSEYITKFEQLLSAQQKTLKKYQVGKTVKSLEKFCQKELKEDSSYFTHSLGHGIGLEVHEAPSISVKAKYKLTENDIVTCEPGLYFPGQFGIRIEDLLVIRKDGPDVLSKTTKMLITLT